MTQGKPDVAPDGTRYWRREGGRLHRLGGPAVELPGGGKCWVRNGALWREGGPAIERADGSCEWYSRGVRHRDGGPAIELASGTRIWYQDGKFVRGEFVP